MHGKRTLNLRTDTMKKNKEKKKKHILWYVLYTMLLTFGFLYYLFPGEAFTDYIKATADKKNPRYVHSVREMALSLPLGLKLVDPRLSKKSDPDKSLFTAKRATIRPVMRSLLDGKPKICFSADAYEGDLNGCLRFESRDLKSPFAVSIQIKNVRIHDNAYLEEMIGRRVDGILGGVLEYRGEKGSWIKGAGEGDLRIAKGRFELLQPFFIFESLNFDEVSLRFVLENQRINVTQAQLNSPEIKGSISGTIILKNNLSKSVLSLRGSIEPFAGLFQGTKGASGAVQFFKKRLRKGKLSFTVRGTLEEPRFRLI